jgi:hypothetical protein
VAGATRGSPRSARETVGCETPATLAMSRLVTRPFMPVARPVTPATVPAPA